MKFGSLFAGIGGFDLGFERAGMQCAWQVEKDEYARRVLAKHWPDVPRHDDVCTFPTEPAEQWRVDVICGGFPCQDISNAGKRVGIDGERSGLWSEYARIIRVLRPRYVVVENVAALLVRGIDRVLGDLAACGYDAEWFVLPAAAVGAPHIRERLFIVAFNVAYTEGIGGELRQAEGRRSRRLASRGTPSLPDADGHGKQQPQRVFKNVGGRFSDRLANDQWTTEPDVGRVANGVPARVDRLRGLGNAVVPQVAEWIGRRLMEAQWSA